MVLKNKKKEFWNIVPSVFLSTGKLAVLYTLVPNTNSTVLLLITRYLWVLYGSEFVKVRSALLHSWEG